jgi:hypothetical protein
MGFPTQGGHWPPVWWQTGRRTPLWWLVFVGGSVLLAVETLLEVQRKTLPFPDLGLALAGQVAEFTVGLLFWMWRPRNIVGPLLALWPLLALTTDLPAIFLGSRTAWRVFLLTAGLYGAVYVNAVLLFPSGRLQSRRMILVVACVYAVLWAHWLPVLLFNGWPGAPPFLHSWLYVGHS